MDEISCDVSALKVCLENFVRCFDYQRQILSECVSAYESKYLCLLMTIATC